MVAASSVGAVLASLDYLLRESCHVRFRARRLNFDEIEIISTRLAGLGNVYFKTPPGVHKKLHSVEVCLVQNRIYLTSSTATLIDTIHNKLGKKQRSS
jgi:hypothetical protein